MKFALNSLLLFCSVLGSVGCTTLSSTMEKWSSLNNSKREYTVKAAWVRQTTEKENLEFRKINRMTPIVAEDLVIQGNGVDGLVAYTKRFGYEKWRLKIENGVEPSATVINDRLFVGASDGKFYSIEMSTGRIEWQFDSKSENLAKPLLHEGVVYFLAGNNVFYALDASNGQQLWLYSRQDTSEFSIRGGSQAALHNGVLYVGFSDGSLVALNASNGSPAWEVLLNKNKRFRDIDATPVIDGQNIYVSGYDDKLYCLNFNGEIQWRIDGGGYSPVTVVSDRIYYPTTNGEVLALNKNNGSVIWKFSVPDGIATEVQFINGDIVIGESQGALRFLDTGLGKEIGSFTPGRGILSTPWISEKDNRVYFISGEANLYAIEARWTKIPYFN